MEIMTTVRDFSEKMKYFHIPPDTYIRVIIDHSERKTSNEKMVLPMITHEEQKRILNLIPKEYDPGASEELTKIIGESHVNTETLEF